MRRLVEPGLGDPGLEPDVAAQVEAVGDVVGIAQDLGLGGVALGPFPFLLQLGRELVGILDAFDVAARAGIAVPVPGAADALAGLEHPHPKTLQAQAVQHVHAAEPGADDHRIEIEGHTSSGSKRILAIFSATEEVTAQAFPCHLLSPRDRTMADTDYPASWYAATRDSSPDHAPLSARTEADVAVVGGGFAGLHTARLLAMRGLRVVLVERRRIGWGAPRRKGGFCGAGFPP